MFPHRGGLRRTLGLNSSVHLGSCGHVRTSLIAVFFQTMFINRHSSVIRYVRKFHFTAAETKIVNTIVYVPAIISAQLYTLP